MSQRQKSGYKGSVTVEAALLMGLILMVLFLIIQMDLFLADSVRMTAILTEDSTYTEEESEARTKWFAAQKKGLFYLKTDNVSHSAGQNRITDSYPAAEISLGYGISTEISQKITRDVRHPVDFLWKVQTVVNCGKSG